MNYKFNKKSDTHLEYADMEVNENIQNILKGLINLAEVNDVAASHVSQKNFTDFWL